MIYLPKVMALRKAGGEFRTYSGFKRRVWITERNDEFTILHELHPTASTWLKAEGYY